jgi:hypothetical protein
MTLMKGPADMSSEFLTRRRFLKASGVCLALPWLERFASARGAADAPNRAVFLFVPNGVNMWEWHPATTGKDYELTPPLRNLAGLRDRFTAFSGLQHIKAGGGHQEAALWLTGNPNYASKKEIYVTPNTISIDQHIAGAIGRQTRWPSMVVGADGGQYTCSFDAEGRPVLADFDLASIFAELVGADPKGRLPQRGSILDLVANQAAGLRRELGKSDERKLDEYVESIRALEKRVQADMAWKSTFRREAIQDDRLNLRADPHNTPDGVDFVDTMLELIYLALRIDCTRVAAFSAYRSSQCCVLKHLGFDVHTEGHNSGDALPEDKPKHFANLSKADAWWTERLARFLDRLRTTREGEHDMLRHTTVLYGSGMSWPAYHRNHNLPILLAGGEGVGFAHGQHIAFNGQRKDIPSAKQEHRNGPKLGPDAVSMSDLLRTISERMGVPAEGFGESRRVLTELLA